MLVQQLTLFKADGTLTTFDFSENEDWTSDCWRTPNTPAQPIVNLVVECLGGIGLDPTADTGKKIPASRHFTREENCLIQDWICEPRTVFLNPPYSNPHPFLVKLAEQLVTFKNIKEAIALLPSRCIHNKNSGGVIADLASAFCHWRSPRIAFLDRSGTPIKNANFDCSLIYFGTEPEKFGRIFSFYGTIAKPLKI